MAGASDEMPFISSDDEHDKNGGETGPKPIKV
jgi:hypothetical protein